MNKHFVNALATVAMAGFALAPISAMAQGHGNGHGRGHDKGHWNPAPPKKNGRHDNRDWNKHRGNDDDNWRGHDDWRGQDEWNRTNSMRRGSVQSQIDRRQQTKNEWRNLAIGAGLVGALGLLTHEKTLVFGGAAGALYSLYRYEQDRKSQSQMQRARAFYFSQPSFVRDGHRYTRRTITQNGQRYYQFVRG